VAPGRRPVTVVPSPKRGAIPTLSEVWFVGAPVSLDIGVDEAVLRAAAVVPTRPGDRHLTLTFLGREPAEDVLRLWRRLPPLSLPDQVRPLGWEVFGRRSVAVSLADPSGRLRGAAHACFDVADEQLTDFQRPPELRPHVTLGRVRRAATAPSATTMGAWPLPAEPVALGPPTLYRVADEQGGDRYEIVEQQPPAPSGPYAAGVRYRFSALLWEHPGDAAWHFVTLPDDHADEIRAVTADTERRGFGSVRVEVTLGDSTWATSIFPDKESGSYVLPVKKDVRAGEGIAAGDTVELSVALATPTS